MMVKDEEEMLPRCLASIRDEVDEIVVVDTGSTDRTVEIALSFGARVFHHPWANDFSLHRNQSISYSSGEWIFIIDADEEYRPSRERSLREEVVLAEQKGIDTLVLRVENFQSEGRETVCSDSIRAFRKNGRICYEGIVHNKLVGFGNPGGSLGRIVHYGYDRGMASARKKFERTATLLRKQIAENPENAAAHMYLSASHEALEQHEDTLREARIAVDLVEAQGISNHQYVRAYYSAARALLLKKQYDEAETFCDRAEARFGAQIDILAARTMIRFQKKDWTGVATFGTRYRQNLENYRNFTSEKILTHIATYGDAWKILGWMGTAKIQLGQLEEGEALYRQSLEVSPDQELLHRHAGLTLISAGHVGRARPYLEEARRLSRTGKDSRVVEALFKTAVLMKDPSLGERSVRDALALPGESSPWLLDLSEFAFRHGDTRIAFLVLTGLVADDEGNIPARLRLARLLVLMGMIEEAVRECDALLRLLSLPRDRTLASLQDLADLFRDIGKIRDASGDADDGLVAGDIARLLTEPPACQAAPETR